MRIGVGRPDTTDPEIVSAHVLGKWRQSAGEVRELVERARDEAERLVTTAGGQSRGAPPGPAVAAGPGVALRGAPSAPARGPAGP